MSRRAAKQWAGHGLDDLRARWGREAVHLYGSIDSTNDAARELAEDEAPEGTIVLSREQTAGRGRGRHAWHSPPRAGLYLSMVFRPGGIVRPAMVSVLAGLGVVLELDRTFPDLTPSLKWPNDLIADDRKLGGILGEASWHESVPSFLVVGVGLNVRSMAKTLPKKLKRRSTWIEEHQPDADLVSAADAAIRGLERYLHRPPETLDGSTLNVLDRYDWLKNRRATVLPSGDEGGGVAGVCVGIAPDGALLFRPDRGALRRVALGRVEVAEP